MSLRMWRNMRELVSVEEKKGHFDISYGKDSDSQKLDIWMPEGEGSFPAIISIHGGGFIVGDKRGMDMITSMLKGLEKGYAVIGINYRLSTEAPFPAAVKDVKQAVRFIKANADEWNIDPEKMIAWGGSAGGYFTLMACLCAEDDEFDNPEDPNLNIPADLAGGVSWYPVTDMQTLDQELQMNSVINSFLRTEFPDVSEEYGPEIGNTQDSDFPFHDKEDSAERIFLGGDPKGEIGKISSPIHRIHKNIPPIFVQHGSGDEILPMQQSIRFALKANEICGEERVKLEIVPHAIHASLLFETEENLEKVFEFIDICVQ